MSTAHWVGLVQTRRVGGKTITRLLEHFGSLEAVYRATPEQLSRVKSIGADTAAAIGRIDLDSVQADIRALGEQGIQILTWGDLAFPRNLLQVDDAPPVLFVRGALQPQDARAVGIVGTRSPGALGADLASRLAYELAVRGWTIVSGLAIGIDTAAHQGALEGGGRTLAVIGAGLNRIHPRRNVPLVDRICQSGAALCEVYPDTPVSGQVLVARNRIISGLSRAVLVVEAGKQSGSIATARRARAQGRAIFAVGAGGDGCEELIQQGATALAPAGIDWDALSEQLAQLHITLPTPDDSPRPQQFPLF